ncbi:hypothetical protein PGB90_008798 [Kerria lacca]
MKISVNDLIFLSYVMLTTLCSMTVEDKKQLSIDGKFHQINKESTNVKGSKPQSRLQRDNKRHHPLPPGLFSALNSLLGGTVIDTFTAYRNISGLIQTAFAPPRPTTGNATAPMNGTTFTLKQALTLVERNYRGLRKLFDIEFAKALNESHKNAVHFRKELKNSVKMYLEYEGARTTNKVKS